MTDADARMSFFDHVGELRQRLLRASIAVIVASCVCGVFSPQLYDFIANPLLKLLPKDSALVFTGLPDAFFMLLKLSIAAGLYITLPYLLYELWRFIAPGLYEHERRYALPFLACGTGLFYAGGAFAYLVAFPVIFNFFLGFQTPELKPMLSVRDYVSLLLKLTLTFGAVFETPVVIVFLGFLRLLNSGMLRRGRRYFIVIAFIIGAILSPPDVFSQVLMAVPLVLLYEVSIPVLAIIERRRDAAQAEWERTLTEPEDHE